MLAISPVRIFGVSLFDIPVLLAFAPVQNVAPSGNVTGCNTGVGPVGYAAGYAAYAPFVD